jgi:hypothetical protein
MFDLNRNSQICDMIAEGEIANLLSHFNSDYIMTVINENINKRFNYNPIGNNPNIVASYEYNFKDLLQKYPSDNDNILQVRFETYRDIINTICNSFKLQYVGIEETDIYSAAYYLYEFLVCGFANNMVTFFANYIYKNREAIYNNMDLAKYRKDKDASTIYGKRAFNDPKIAVIISKMNEVLYYISGFDIGIYNILSLIMDKQKADFISSIIVPCGNFFKENFCAVISPLVITDIRLKIHNLATEEMNSNPDNI